MPVPGPPLPPTIPAQVRYAQITDLTNLSLPAQSLGTLTVAQQNGALDSASATIDMYLRDRYQLPLVAWGQDITQIASDLAAFALMVVRGYNPDSGPDEHVRLRAKVSTERLELMAAGKLTPNVIDSTSAGTPGGPFTAQPTVSPSANQATLGGPSTVVSGVNGAQVTVGAPNLRGW